MANLSGSLVSPREHNAESLPDHGYRMKECRQSRSGKRLKSTQHTVAAGERNG